MKFKLSTLVLAFLLATVGCDDNAVNETPDTVRDVTTDSAPPLRDTAPMHDDTQFRNDVPPRDDQVQQQARQTPEGLDDRYDTARPVIEDETNDGVDPIEDQGQSGEDRRAAERATQAESDPSDQQGQESSPSSVDNDAVTEIEQPQGE